MTCRANDRPIPPNSWGHDGPAMPASYIVACHALTHALRSAASRGRLPGWWSANHCRTMSRNSSSVPVRSRVSTVCVISHPHQVGDPRAVCGGSAEEYVGSCRAPQVEMGVALPRVADAAMDLDVLAAGPG